MAKYVKYEEPEEEDFEDYRTTAAYAALTPRSKHLSKRGEPFEDIDEGYKNATFNDETGEIFEGGWQDGKRYGKGICLFANGFMYEGNWVAGQENGRGQLMDGDRKIIYIGEWADGLMHGHGSYNYPNGDKYIGDWKEGAIHGIIQHPIPTQKMCK
jgi:hypothetical protein